MLLKRLESCVIMETRKPNEQSDLEALRRKAIIKSCFIYCFAILLSPALTFFCTKAFIFQGLLELDEVVTNVCSAVASVIALHIALGMFIYKAYSYASLPQKSGKED